MILVLGVLLVGSIGAVYQLSIGGSGPSYEGKTASAWIWQCSTNLQKAPPIELVREMGTNAMPVLAKHLVWAKPETYRWWQTERHSKTFGFIYRKLNRYNRADVAYKWLGMALREVPYSLESMLLTFKMEEASWILRSRERSDGASLKYSLQDIEWNSKSERARARAKKIREMLEAEGVIAAR